MKTPEEILAHKRELDRKRAQKYYNSKKEIISERRKIKRDELKQKDILNYDAIIGKLGEHIKNENTLRKYKDKLNSLFRLFKCATLDEIIFDYNNTIQQLEKFKMLSDPTKNYSIATIKEFYQIILIIIMLFDLNLSEEGKEAYNKKFKELKFEINLKSVEKITDENEAVPDFDQYLNLIKDKFGVNSKEYLISYLYYEVTARDNFYLVIVHSENDILDKTKNYLIYNIDSNCYVILNDYKTKNKYGKKKYILSDTLKQLIKNYISNRKLNYGDYLFNNQNLTQFIYNFNKKIGQKVTINTLRHMKASKNLDTNEKESNSEHMVKLSNNMGNSIETSMKYKRIIKPVIIYPVDFIK